MNVKITPGQVSFLPALLAGIIAAAWSGAFLSFEFTMTKRKRNQIICKLVRGHKWGCMRGDFVHVVRKGLNCRCLHCGKKRKGWLRAWVGCSKYIPQWIKSVLFQLKSPEDELKEYLK